MPNVLPFQKVFANRIFRVPDYQRGYSWQESQLEDLWTDLENITLLKSTYHFTGILTINKFSENDFQNLIYEGFENSFDIEKNTLKLENEEFQTFNLVDGQQRITTILILLYVLINRLQNRRDRDALLHQYFFKKDKGNKYLFGYHVDVPSHNYLIRDIFGDDDYGTAETKTLYTHNLDFAKDFFRQKLITQNFVAKNITDMIAKINERLLFSVLNLSEDSGKNLDISMVFETLNFRGKQLSGLERFKNRVLFLLTKQLGGSNSQKLRENINKTWLEVYKWLGRNPDPKKVMEDDAFLKAFWLLQFSSNTMVAKDFKSYQKNLFDKDFDILTYQNYRHMNPVQLPIWLKNMRRAVVLWYFINNPYQIETDNEFDFHYSPNIQRSLRRLNNFPFGYGKYMLNLVLALLMRLLPLKIDGKFLSNQEEKNLKIIEDFLWAAERHNIICFLFYGHKTNFNQETTFRDINRYFITGNAGIEGVSLIEQLKTTRVSHFNWGDFDHNLVLGNFFFTWDGLQFVFREYEESLSGERIDKDISINRIYVEDHESRISYGDINRLRTKRKKYSYALGNIFISNNSHTPRDFAGHKIRIKNAVKNQNFIYESERELLGYRGWNANTIDERSKKILNFIIEKWDLPKPGEKFWNNYFS